jgi:hypothetical protein
MRVGRALLPCGARPSSTRLAKPEMHDQLAISDSVFGLNGV